MRSIDRLASSFFIAFAVATRALAADADCLALLTAQVVRELGADADLAFRIAARTGPASDGLAAALRSRPNDGGARVRQIIEYFGEDVTAQALEQVSLVKHADRLGDLIVNLGKQDSDAVGAAAVLRYATRRIDPTTVRGFEFPIPSGRIADIVDSSGNLIEVKALNLTGYNDFVAEIELRKILPQAAEFQQHALGEGKRLFLAFENPIPGDLQDVFDDVLGELLSQPNVVLINGF